MRLIDLDDALESIKREIANVACPNTVLYVLENRPQVDAIPIEWIKNHYGSLKIAQMIIEGWENNGKTD